MEETMMRAYQKLYMIMVVGFEAALGFTAIDGPVRPRLLSCLPLGFSPAEQGALNSPVQISYLRNGEIRASYPVFLSSVFPGVFF